MHRKAVISRNGDMIFPCGTSMRCQHKIIKRAKVIWVHSLLTTFVGARRWLTICGSS